MVWTLYTLGAVLMLALLSAYAELMDEPPLIGLRVMLAVVWPIAVSVGALYTLVGVSVRVVLSEGSKNG